MPNNTIYGEIQSFTQNSEHQFLAIILTKYIKYLLY